uniref:Uncharacterized protein n=1 Tax=Candidatus Kentrum sp. TC TaxID=2126339 RepID=A0A450YP10_9GAMM|nr:MAG: hypothetical protein BECKTC1821E_GA0114239_102411 [Candidatus Kentron sp. TC]
MIHSFPSQPGTQPKPKKLAFRDDSPYFRAFIDGKPLEELSFLVPRYSTDTKIPHAIRKDASGIFVNIRI